jgi:hypothetical protein
MLRNAGHRTAGARWIMRKVATAFAALAGLAAGAALACEDKADTSAE